MASDFHPNKAPILRRTSNPNTSANAERKKRREKATGDAPKRKICQSVCSRGSLLGLILIHTKGGSSFQGSRPAAGSPARLVVPPQAAQGVHGIRPGTERDGGVLFGAATTTDAHEHIGVLFG